MLLFLWVGCWAFGRTHRGTTPTPHPQSIRPPGLAAWSCSCDSSERGLNPNSLATTATNMSRLRALFSVLFSCLPQYIHLPLFTQPISNATSRSVSHYLQVGILPLQLTVSKWINPFCTQHARPSLSLSKQWDLSPYSEWNFGRRSCAYIAESMEYFHPADDYHKAAYLPKFLPCLTISTHGVLCVCLSLSQCPINVGW